jgi:HPt (histidine-containing phosphotransfer) domain-containing protein
MPLADPRLTELTARYRASLPIKGASVQLAWHAYRAEPGAPAAAPTLQRILHRLAGSAPSYGYEEIGQLAAEAEGLLEERGKESSGIVHGPRRFDRLEPLIDRLLKALLAGDDAPRQPIARAQNG